MKTKTVSLVLLFLLAALTLACNAPARSPADVPTLTEQPPSVTPPPTQTVAPSPTATATQPPTAPPASVEDSRLAYGRQGHLCLMKPDGSERMCIPPAKPALADFYPYNFAWSPKGTHIAYMQSRSLVIHDLHGGQARVRYEISGEEIESLTKISGPVWDAAGEYLAISTKNLLYYFPLNESDTSYLAADNVWGQSANYEKYNLGWTAGRSHLLYISGGEAYDALEGLSAVSMENPAASRLLVPNAIHFALSPDGAQLLYRLKDGGIYLVDSRCVDKTSGRDCTADARLLVALEDEPLGGMWNFRWSPDSRFILMAFIPMAKEVCLMDAATGEFLPLPDEIAHGGYSHFRSSSPWSPDGKQIVLTHAALVLPYTLDSSRGASYFTVYNLETQQWHDITEFEEESQYRETSWGFIAP